MTKWKKKTTRSTMIGSVIGHTSILMFMSIQITIYFLGDWITAKTSAATFAQLENTA